MKFSRCETHRWQANFAAPQSELISVSLNRLSGPEVGYRDIKMYYFKDRTEMLDYYQRGFRAAKRELQV